MLVTQHANSKRFCPACRAALALLFTYKAVVSPLLPKACRFLPTCSSVSAATCAAPLNDHMMPSSLCLWSARHVCLALIPAETRGCGSPFDEVQCVS